MSESRGFSYAVVLAAAFLLWIPIGLFGAGGYSALLALAAIPALFFVRYLRGGVLLRPGDVKALALTGGLALGASGALMFIFGCLVVLMPKEKVLFYGIIPMPFWAMGILYAVLDILGAIGPANGVGNFAHLSGMALGLGYGWRLRDRIARPR